MRYYTAQQTLELLNKELPHNPLPYDLAQLADLCSRAVLTPTVFYSKGLGHIDREAHYHQQHQTIKGACTFKGYITHDALGDLLTDYANTNTPAPASDAPIARFSTATIYETCRAYYAWGDNTNSPPPYNHGDTVALLSSEPSHDEPHPPTTHNKADSDIFTVTPTMLRLPADEVHQYVDDVKAEHARKNEQLDDNTAKDYLTTIGLLLELLQRKPKGFNKDGTDLPAIFPSQAQIIEAIDEQAITSHRYGKVEKRFSLANKALADKRKQ